MKTYVRHVPGNIMLWVDLGDERWLNIDDDGFVTVFKCSDQNGYSVTWSPSEMCFTVFEA